MTTQITDKEPPIPVNPAIPLQEALTRVKAWLKFLKDIPPFNKKPATIPRAIFVATEDFLAMIKQCETKYPGYDIKGVRIYFGLKPAADDPKGPADRLCGMMVPVLHKDNQWGHADAVYTNLVDPNPNDTSIYDFTATCPDFCDPSSELYAPIPVS
jgi:hypothetical protein